MKWVRQPELTGSNDESSFEWDEHWIVTGYAPPAGEPAWIGLLADRPEFRHGRKHYVSRINARVAGFEWDRLSTTRDAWEVVVRYRHDLAQERESVNPLDRPAEIDLDSEGVSVPIDRDADGRPILSSAGGLIAGLTEEVNHWTFNVAKNVAVLPRWLLQYGNAVNADAVRIGGLTIAPGYLMLRRPRAGKPQSAQVGDRLVEYRELTFSLIYNPATWILRYYDRDIRELQEVEVEVPDPSSPVAGATKTVKKKQPVLITTTTEDGEKVPIDEPVFLDGKGRRPRGKDGSIKSPLDPSDIVTLERWTKRRLPFRVLPLT